jgi:hypothetical protein
MLENRGFVVKKMSALFDIKVFKFGGTKRDEIDASKKISEMHRIDYLDTETITKSYEETYRSIVNAGNFVSNVKSKNLNQLVVPGRKVAESCRASATAKGAMKLNDRTIT